MPRALSAFARILAVLAGRGVAFIIDLCLVAVTSSLIYGLLESANLWVPDPSGYHLYSVTLSLAILTVAKIGRTPGLFLVGLDCRTTTEGLPPKLYSALVRSSVLVLGPLVLFTALDLIDKIFASPLLPVTYLVVGFWYAIIFGTPLVISGGRVGLHDLLADTRTDFEGSTWKAKVNLKRILLVIITGLAVVHMSIIAYISVRMDDIQKDTHSSLNPSLRYLESKYLDLIFTTEDVGDGIEDFFRYYIDDHGYLGSTELKSLDHKIGISGRTIQLPPSPGQRVHIFDFPVTFEGIVSSRFQEQIASNISNLAYKNGAGNYSIVQFTYRDNFFGIIHCTVIRRLVVIRKQQQGSLNVEYQTVTPKVSGSLVIATSEENRLSIFQRTYDALGISVN